MKLDARIPMFAAVALMAILSVAAIVLVAVGRAPWFAVIPAALILLACAGVPLMARWKRREERMPNAIPGFGARFGGEAAATFSAAQYASLLRIIRAQVVAVGFATVAQVDAIFGRLQIEAKHGESFEYGMGQLHGVCVTRYRVIFAVRNNRSLTHTSLAHEILHAIRWQAKGDPDAGHADKDMLALEIKLREVIL